MSVSYTTEILGCWYLLFDVNLTSPGTMLEFDQTLKPFFRVIVITYSTFLKVMDCIDFSPHLN